MAVVRNNTKLCREPTRLPPPQPSPPAPTYTWTCLPRSTAGRHHKAADTLADRNVITRLFYGCYPFFAFCCVGTELFYVALYLLVFVPEASFELGAGMVVSLHAVRFFAVLLCAGGRGWGGGKKLGWWRRVFISPLVVRLMLFSPVGDQVSTVRKWQKQTPAAFTL